MRSEVASRCGRFVREWPAVVFAALAFLLLGSAAGAATTLTMSDCSNNEEVAAECLDAEVSFSVAGNTLTLDVVNKTPESEQDLRFRINAVYFNGDWTISFDSELTAERPFHLSDGSVKQVPMMTYPGPVEVHRFSDGNVEVIDLPYAGEAYSMTIIMPAARNDIAVLVDSLDSERWQQIVTGLAPTRTNVLMPKFRLDYELELQDALRTLGMGIAFTHAADFSKICTNGLFISRIKHKAFVDLNEQGTEASAATAVELKRGAPASLFAVDRPFLFVIRERSSGTILFVGRIADPTLAS